MDRPVVVRKDELRGEPTPTVGVTRFEAFGHEHVWMGRIENDADHEGSDWHVHPGHDTYGYAVSGRFFVEFGPGGAERIEVGPGDFVVIPQGVVHREGNAGDGPNDGVIVRVGEGQVTVNLEGPDPA